MKKLFALLLTLAMVLSLAACGSKKEEAPAETPAEEPAEKSEGWWKDELTTVTDGVLTVATSPDFAPYEFYAIGEDGTPTLAGFDMALAQYIADYMGLELEVIPMDFDGVLTELATKTVDLGMAGLSPDPKRADAMAGRFRHGLFRPVLQGWPVLRVCEGQRRQVHLSGGHQ